MKLKSSPALIRLPKKAELAICLLREELKSNKFFSTMATAGMEDSPLQPYLNTPILRLMGFDQVSDDLMTRYLELLDMHTAKIKDDSKSALTKRAFLMYVELMAERRKAR